eukprot:g44423.t1
MPEAKQILEVNLESSDDEADQGGVDSIARPDVPSLNEIFAAPDGCSWSDDSSVFCFLCPVMLRTAGSCPCWRVAATHHLQLLRTPPSRWLHLTGTRLAKEASKEGGGEKKAEKGGKKGGKKDDKGKGGDAAGGAFVAKDEKTPVAFVQVFQDMEPVKLLPDDQYPDWLWTIHEPLPSLRVLKQQGFDNLNAQMKRRYLKLERKHRIKENNRKALVRWSPHFNPRVSLNVKSAP